jgi:ribonuclease P protein component
VHKSAVGRNRIRRRVYEILRAELPKITKAHDVAVIVSSSEVMQMPHDELVSQLQHLLQEAGLYDALV